MASYTDPLEQATPAADDTIRHDPRQNHDDPLLDSLMIVCKLHNIISSRNVLTAGLPLKDNQLTLDTFPRAAQRAGLRRESFSVRWKKSLRCRYPQWCY